MRRHLWLATGAAMVVAAQPAIAQAKQFDIPAQPAESAITALGRQAGVQIVAARSFSRGKRTNAVRGAMSVDAALTRLLEGTGLRAQRSGPQTYVVLGPVAAMFGPVSAPASASARQVAAGEPQLPPGVTTDQPADGATGSTTAANVPAEGQAEEPARDVVVTGSRIVSSGFTAPTPTQVLSYEAITKNAQPNVFTTVAQLPALQGSTGATVGANGTSTGVQGLSTLSLRGLQPIRTLTLIDGQRVVGANVTGVADVSLFPQLLIERVDVVTGGASASYGSDAVGGVVNFVTNTRFTGFRANVMGGISTYGDDANWTVQAAAGKSLAGDRLHLIVSGEYSHEDGIPSAGFGVGNDPNGDGPNGRTWLVARGVQNRGITTDGLPQYLVRDHVQSTLFGRYGLINAGPLAGTAFDVNGNPVPFRYGTGCLPGSCIGGDLSGSVTNGNSFKSEITRLNSYGRIGFDVDPDNEIYATLNVARVDTSNTPNPGSAQDNLTIQCSNPFVPAAIQSACAANGITSFRFGTVNPMFDFIDVNTRRHQYRGVVGAKGKVAAFGTDWRYDAYYEHGTGITDINVNNIPLMPRYRAAIQAVRGANGVITCADPVAVASGCSPLNVFGGQAPTDATRYYIEPQNGPYQHTRQTQDVASFSVSGEPVALPAGPLAVAFGAEFRHEFYRVTADPYGNGVLTGNGYTDDYPADPLLSQQGGNWYAGNYRNGSGGYDVLESYLELNAPLFDSESIGRANLNVAGRATNYSTSGTVYTWKVGGTWDTPLDGFRLRGVTSRDIRAPNLSELFAAPVTSNRTGTIDPFNGNRSITVLQTTTGNRALTPEIARNTEVGFVLSRASWLPGFSLSVDYFRIKIDDAISALDAQTQINLCYGGVQFTCGSFDLSNLDSAYVTVQPFNFASIFTDGLDIEASYTTKLDGIGLPGRLSLRGLATHTINFVQDTGLPGTIPRQLAGTNIEATAVPHWKVLASQDWSTDTVSFTVQERWFSAGVFSNENIVCQTNCPVSTVNHPTYDYNRVPGALYVDLAASYRFTPAFQAYAKVDNVFNRDGETVPGNITTPTLYDVVGRAFRLGLRANF
ncbi:TonB-dependent receptor [Sphingomonas sp. RRHST34]|uniref:TonB-dependent receptor n=1 Tax=Sphingomonas citri TaxID=2862499 RepID=A0ABS7BSK0_9SPHN|nr:TonB-dependent receptor [Sphingomonas citri]MBW6532551.1 TonB-dependent receptor [Sphingomonas citri]